MQEARPLAARGAVIHASRERRMDALSAALSSVRMTGAIFYHAVCTAPWGFAVPPMQRVAQRLAPGAERLIGYHLLTEGEALCRFADGTAIELRAGDVIIIPHGDAHTVTNGAPRVLEDSEASLGSYLAGDLHTMELGGGGPVTHFICGYFGCEQHADRLFLSGLPRAVHINVRSDAAGEWLESSIQHLVSEASSGRPGKSALLSKMAEALFIETLRRYMEQMPPDQAGWLAGARDPIVGASLALLHRRTRDPWTLAMLAAAVGTSRSILTERFTRLLGEPPLRYLAHWRLQLAARLLTSGSKPIVQVALDVGYESEAAFNRAFKREFGVPPGRFRRQGGGASAAPSRERRHAPLSSAAGTRTLDALKRPAH
jgi:AraC-like DNA-binding protein